MLNDDSAAHCPAWKQKYPFSLFFVQASVPSRLASAPHPPSTRGTNVLPSMTYAHRIPPACRFMPTFFLLHVSVPFYQVVKTYRQTAAKLHMQGYHTCTMFYVSKLWYNRACKRIYATTHSDIFACHIENRACGFLAGVWLQWAVSPLCLNNLGKFGLILIGASDEANMSTSSNNVTIFMKSVRYDGLFRSLNSWVTNLFYIKIVVTKNIPNLKESNV